MKKLLVLFAIIVAISFISCTENSRVKHWGGDMRIELPVNAKLVNVTWKEGQLWFLTKPMNTSDTPETYEFFEKSKLGILEGSVTIIEKKQ